MKIVCKSLLCLLLYAGPASAQSPIPAGVGPAINASLGYSNMSRGASPSSRIGMNGVGASITGALSPRHGVTVDLSYMRASNVFGTGRHGDVLSYLGGPVFYTTRRRELVTYVHGLLGGAKVSGVIPLNTGGFATGYVHHVAWAFGGGIEHWFSDSMAVRVSADAIHTSFYDSSLAIRGQYDLRTMWSVAYYLGRQKRGRL